MPSHPTSARATPASASPAPSFAASGLGDPGRQLRWGGAEVHEVDQMDDLDVHPQEQDEAEGAEEGDDTTVGEGTHLAITAARGRVGCCFFDPLTDKLSFLEDQQDSTGWDLTHLVIEQLLPANVVTSSTADATFLEALDAQLAALPLSLAGTSAASAPSDAGEAKTRLEYRPAREFYAGPGKYALSQLHIAEGGWYAEAEEEERDSGYDSGLGGEADNAAGFEDAYDFGDRPAKRRKLLRDVDMDGDAARRNRELRVEAFLNNLSTSPLTIGCAGALLNHVNKTRSNAGELDGTFEIKGLQLMKLDKVMLVNSDALTSLQVFEDEAHAATGSSRTKEGLSLFGIVNVTRTPLGKLLMRQWFIRPSVELGVIEARHDAVECFARNENQHAIDAIQLHFKHVKNVRRVFKALAGGSGSIADWQSTWMFVFSSIQIRDAVLCLEHRTGIEVIDNLLDSFDSRAFKDLGEMINNVIDWQESQLKSQACVRRGVDADLDKLRRQYDGLESFLSSVAKDVARDLPRELAKELSLCERGSLEAKEGRAGVARAEGGVHGARRPGGAGRSPGE